MFTALVAFGLALGGSQAMSTAPSDILANASAVLSKVTSRPVRAFSTRDFGRDAYADARSVLVDETDADRLLARVRHQLGPGLVAFIGTERSLADTKPDGVELVVGPGETQFDILRIAASDAVNFDKETEDLIKVLKTWDVAFGIDILRAQTDRIVLHLKSMPIDMKKFTADVYEFCPDIVDQGTGSIDKLQTEITTTRTVFLWWD
ncbi:MAG: DUF4253 domain-containing protein [Pseudomonadota bacterium]